MAARQTRSGDRPRKGPTPLSVTVIGAGIAGMTASYRLLQRGFHVTLLEQDQFMGGMLRACRFDDDGPGTDERHEHSYHMVLNWYHNLWDLIDELGVREHLTPSNGFTFLWDGGRRAEHMYDVGAPEFLVKNVLSGAAPLPDLFLFMYSLVDMLATPIRDGDFLDDYSVNAFLRSRPYATERVAELHQKVWETVWAIPSYDASAKSYQTFLKYGNYVPVPGMWLFNRNKYDALIGPMERALREFERFEFVPGARITSLELGHRGDVDAVVYDRVEGSPSLSPGRWEVVERGVRHDVTGDLIVATTPGTLADLVRDEVFQRDPDLGRIRKLRAEPMASVEFHLREGTWLRDVPSGVTVLMDADYQMTFLDYSQLWKEPKQRSTFLYVTVSDFDTLLSLPAERRERGRDGRRGALVLDLERPSTAIEYLLVQLRNALAFEVDDVDLVRTCIQTNTGEELFTNETGSAQWRPDTVTKIPNLFIAGTYTRNFADVATIEGAVASGLMAAEAVRSRSGVTPPIPVKEPGYYHPAVFQVLRLAWAPYAFWAKVWSMMNDVVTPSGDLLRSFVETWRRMRDPGAPDPYRASRRHGTGSG